MLVKLRISNEKEWVKGEHDSKHTYEDQFTEAYEELKETLKEDKIPVSIFSSYSVSSQCQFVFNGFDSKTNTYFFEFIGTIG